MGGQTSTTQATQQQSSTQPWKPAQPYLQQGLPQIGAAINNTAATPAQNSAFSQMFQNLNGLPNFGGAASNAAGSLLGIDNPNSTVNSAYNSMKANYAPYTGQDYLNPYNNPAFQQYMDTIGNDIQNRTNSMFAGAGRDLSGANQNALARGITEGTAPIFANQYNQNVSAQQHAIDQLFGGGLSANQANSGNALAGAGLAGALPSLATANQQGLINATQGQRNLPLQNLGLAQSLLLPIAQLGSQSQGTSNTQGTLTPSPLQQANQWMNLAGNGAFLLGF